MPEKLLMEHVMLLTILSSHIGTEVGKFVVISSSEESSISDLEKTGPHSLLVWE